MPRWIYASLLVLFALSLVPLAFIARARGSKTDKPRIHIIPDMDNQDRYEGQSPNVAFADGRAMRPPVHGTVPFGDGQLDDATYRGTRAVLTPAPVPTEGEELVEAGEPSLEVLPVHSFPVPVTQVMLDRGQERYEIYCAPCHGLSGYGDGMIDKRAAELQEGTWTIPSNLHDQPLREKPVGYLFQVITSGARSMPAYGPQISVEDRWAIVAYLKALQRSQDGSIDDVPPENRDQIRAE